jgi:sugar lactone lactonase YvrE
MAQAVLAGNVDEFRIRREQVFEFSEKPKVTRNGDQVTVTFETKGLCDVTVAIENDQGRIVRHLACGVLGDHAPPPFQKNSKKQTVTWDGKDDQDVYVDDKDRHTVRVSLGLKAQLERTLFWSPKKRVSPRMPLVHASPEGVYVYDGDVVDHIRLFDHQGNYLRTIYPFPSDKLQLVKGLKQQTFPQDGNPLPLKVGFFQATFLTSGPNAGPRHADGHPGQAGRALAVGNDRIALVDRFLNRLGTDGSTGSLDLGGPRTLIPLKGSGDVPVEATPTSVAFSPDGRWLYLAGYTWKKPYSYLANFATLPVVLRMEYAGDKEPELFLGSLKPEEQGKDNEHFNVPNSVVCDAKGRVYVSDFLNDRVQIFSPDGKYLKTIETPKPAQVCVHHKTQEIYVFSWAVPNAHTTRLSVKAVLTRFGPFDDPRTIDSFPLPVPFYEENITEWYGGSHLGYGEGEPVLVTLDSWADSPTIWLSRERKHGSTWDNMGIRMLAVRGGELKEVGDFGKDAVQAVGRVGPATFHRQRLFINPKDGMLYVAEDRGFTKSVVELLKINPSTGNVQFVPLPFSAEDVAFDLNGLIYLRTNDKLVRYDAVTWREVPFDYGEERPDCGFTADGMGLKTTRVMSAVDMPAPVGWHHGGLAVSSRGHIAVSCYNKAPPRARTDTKEVHVAEKYTPAIYPGRTRMGEIHIWDSRGKLIGEDVFPGVAMMNGVGLDRHDHLYVLAAGNRVLDGRPYFNPMAGVLMKVRPKNAKVLSTARTAIPLVDSAKPKRPPDLVDTLYGDGWVEGAEWMYGGVGFGGKNLGTGCACWNCRFVLDYFGRSFAPEIDHFSVAVLDSTGNLILRVGRCGNVDDGRALVPDGGPPSARSLGGDEVALFHAAYLGTMTDRRLFIADAGNERILGVKLSYHADEKVALKDVKDQAK